MSAPSNQITTPQTEEDIQEISWVNQKSIKEKIGNTFPSIKDVIRQFENEEM
jgi:hypothetical protein